METVYAYGKQGNKLAFFDYEPYIIGKSLNEIIGSIGISTEEATQAISQLNDAITELRYDGNEYDNRINITKSKVDMLESSSYCITSTIDTLEERVTALEKEVNELLKYKELLSQLQPALVERAENRKSKIDLEIFDRIVPTYEFTILSENNIFLD